MLASVSWYLPDITRRSCWTWEERILEVIGEKNPQKKNWARLKRSIGGLTRRLQKLQGDWLTLDRPDLKPTMTQLRRSIRPLRPEIEMANGSEGSGPLWRHLGTALGTKRWRSQRIAVCHLWWLYLTVPFLSFCTSSTTADQGEKLVTYGLIRFPCGRGRRPRRSSSAGTRCARCAAVAPFRPIFCCCCCCFFILTIGVNVGVKIELNRRCGALFFVLNGTISRSVRKFVPFPCKAFREWAVWHLSGSAFFI